MVATSGEFKVPGLGFCGIVQGYATDSPLQIRFRNPNFLDDSGLLGDAVSLQGR